VQWAFPSPDAHDPEAFFYVGKEFWWYEFKSTSEDFDTMYKHYFCGDKGVWYTPGCMVWWGSLVLVMKSVDEGEC
jgi:hypothetical protein